MSPPGDPGHLFVLEKDTGKIKIVNLASSTVNPTPFLDIPDSEFSNGGESGVLGLAFDPAYATNRKFYLFMTNPDGDLEVKSYARSIANPNLAEPGSAQTVITVPHPNFGNHNGGWIGFGPDGMLHVAAGDGGSGGDPDGNAQNLNSLLGKILRIDVSQDGFPGDSARNYAIPADNPFAGTPGADEIWAYGLRNPWRPSFDRQTGDLYIADVGQGAREEVNFQDASSDGGVNYGWKVREGTIAFDSGAAGTPPYTDPVIDYGHGPAPNGGFSVTGGYVYHGQSLGAQGLYVYADFVTNQMWSFRMVEGKAVDVTNRTEQLVASGGAVDQIASFAEDGLGNVYVIGLDGEIFKLSPGAGAGDGADTINGGAGDDRIYGGAGRDRLLGGDGNDSLSGGSQNDFLDGGKGNDRLRGDSGADTFLFALGSGRDLVVDFQDNVDTIRISRSLGVATATEALAHAVQSGANVVFTFGNGDVLVVAGVTKAQLADDILIV
jgi:Ca2+-binding RTX toxin-like protein